MTFYRSNTFNQTFYVDASASSGYKNNIVQTGNIQNQGIELALGYSDTFDKVKVSTNFTYTLNQNKIVSLANGAINPETGEAIEMEYYSKGTLGTSGGPTLTDQWEIFISISVCVSLLMDIFGKTPLMEVWLLKIRNTARLALFFLNIIWDGMVVLLGRDGILDLHSPGVLED